MLPICFYLALGLFWQLYQADSFVQSLKYVPPANSLAQAEKSSQRIWSWFATATVKKAKPVEVSKLDAKLIGILGIGDRGFAMISMKKKPTEAFKVGDVISEGLSLKTLGLDYVVLIHGNKEERLQMKKINLFKKLTATEKKEEVTAQKESDQNNVREWANSLKRDPLELLKVLNFRQTKVAEHGIGYKIRAINEKAIETLRTAGLQDGDILFVANGKPILQLAGNPANLGSLLDGDKLVIRLLRAGVIKDVTISIKE